MIGSQQCPITIMMETHHQCLDFFAILFLIIIQVIQQLNNLCYAYTAQERPNYRIMIYHHSLFRPQILSESAAKLMVYLLRSLFEAGTKILLCLNFKGVSDCFSKNK